MWSVAVLLFSFKQKNVEYELWSISAYELCNECAIQCWIHYYYFSQGFNFRTDTEVNYWYITSSMPPLLTIQLPYTKIHLASSFREDFAYTFMDLCNFLRHPSYLLLKHCLHAYKWRKSYVAQTRNETE